MIFNKNYNYIEYVLYITWLFENGEFEIPTSCKHLNKKSPDLSPVNALPVLVPP